MNLPRTALFKLSPTEKRQLAEIKPPDLTLFLDPRPSQALTIEELEAIQLDAVPRRGNAVTQQAEPKTS